MRKHKITATVYDRKGRVLSVGHNSYTKTHPKQAHYAMIAGREHNVFLHAEVDALVKCKGIAHKIKIERYGRDGNPRDAKPCPICELAIKEAGIRFIEYTVG